MEKIVRKQLGHKTTDELAEALAAKVTPEADLDALRAELVSNSESVVSGNTVYVLTEENVKTLVSKIDFLEKINKPVKMAASYIGLIDTLKEAEGDLELNATQLDLIAELFSLISFSDYESATDVKAIQDALEGPYTYLYEDRMTAKIMSSYIENEANRRRVADIPMEEGPQAQSEEAQKVLSEAAAKA